ncbi:MAG TPA: DUF3089 domain-containing protein [Gaiellaceae bacterium]|nr:DUF3089 domain-containing protein [Gaiellaceae bacterium]
MRICLALALAAILIAAAAADARGGSRSTVWLCRPGLANDPCTASLATTVISATGKETVTEAKPATTSSFDCFYVYPTVSPELSANSDLKVQSAETDVAIAQASRFSTECRVYAPMYRQVTLATLFTHPTLAVGADEQIAYTSLLAGFDDYLAHENDGRPIVFIGHSQGAAILIRLLAHVVDGDAALRHRLVLAIILGGDVEVRTGTLTGGSFAHIPLCSQASEAGCVIAYSSFPSEPPATALFGRVGQGVALQSQQTRTAGLQVACVNPAAVGSRAAAPLAPYFPSLGKVPTPWVSFPGLYRAACRTAQGATWLQVGKATSASDKRPVVTEKDGPDWGYHSDDVNLALGNLVADVAAAERAWTKSH